MITEEQVSKIDDLMMLGDISYERINAAIKQFYKKEALTDLTMADADNFIIRLEKRVQNELSQNQNTASVIDHADKPAEKSENPEEMGTN